MKQGDTEWRAKYLVSLDCVDINGEPTLPIEVTNHDQGILGEPLLTPAGRALVFHRLGVRQRNGQIAPHSGQISDLQIGLN